MNLSGSEQVLLLGILLALLVGMGLNFRIDDLLRPRFSGKSILAALTNQYLFMPLIGIGVAKFFSFSDEMALALLLVTCCPGGTASNFMCYFSKADLKLSIYLTSLTSACCLVMTPLLVHLYSSPDESIQIPLKQIILTLVGSLAPVILGSVLRTLLSEPRVVVLEKALRWSGAAGCLVLLYFWIPRMSAIYDGIGIIPMVAVGLVCLVGVITGALSSVILRLPPGVVKTVAFETGIQNSPLAFAIIALSFPTAFYEAHGWIALLYGSNSLLVGAIFVVGFRKWR